MSVSTLPISIEDGNLIDLDVSPVRTAYMSQVWFLSIGFTIIFTALFSKTLRINRMFHITNCFSKVVVGAQDVLTPSAVLLTTNTVVPDLFTILSPLEFVRLDNGGTDSWYRVTSTYGTCQDRGQAWPYIASLVVINSSLLLLALVADESDSDSEAIARKAAIQLRFGRKVREKSIAAT